MLKRDRRLCGVVAAGGLLAVLSGCDIGRFAEDAETVWFGEDLSLGNAEIVAYYNEKDRLFDLIASDCRLRFPDGRVTRTLPPEQTPSDGPDDQPDDGEAGDDEARSDAAALEEAESSEEADDESDGAADDGGSDDKEPLPSVPQSETRTASADLGCEEILRAHGKAAPQISSRERLNLYLTAGLDYVDHRCDLYFQALRRLQRDFNATSNQIAILGGAAASALGLFEAAAREIAAVALGTTTAVATLDNVRNRLLYKIDATATMDLVERAQATYRGALRPSSITDTLTATIAIREYARLCMPDEIEQRVVAAVRTADLTTDAPQTAPGLSVLRARLADELNVGALGPAQVARLYWLLQLDGAADEAQRTAAVSGLSPALVSNVLTAENEIRPGLDSALALLDALAALDPALVAEARALQRAARQAGEEQTEPAPPPQPPQPPAEAPYQYELFAPPQVRVE